MRKILLGLFICGAMVLAACSKNEETTANNNQSEENTAIETTTDDNPNKEKAGSETTKEETITELNQQVEDLKGQVEILTKESNAYPTISNLTKDFVQAQVTGDKERLSQMITDDVVIEEKGNELYVSTNGNPGYILFSEEIKEQFGGWEIRSAGYNEKNGRFDVFISEFYSTPPTSFVNLYFKEVDNQWKISGIEFDI